MVQSKEANGRNGAKQVHVNLPEEVHQKLRVKCAVENKSIQEYVAEIISRSVDGIEVVDKNKKIA
jgi:plasmid stability protein